MPRKRRLNQKVVAVENVPNPRRKLRQRKAKEGPKYAPPSDNESIDSDVQVDSIRDKSKSVTPSGKPLFGSHEGLKTELHLSSSEDDNETEEETPSTKKSSIFGSKSSKKLDVDFKNHFKNEIKRVGAKECLPQTLNHGTLNGTLSTQGEGDKGINHLGNLRLDGIIKSEIQEKESGFSIFDSPVKDDIKPVVRTEEFESACKRRLDLKGDDGKEDLHDEDIKEKETVMQKPKRRKAVLKMENLKQEQLNMKCAFKKTKEDLGKIQRSQGVEEELKVHSKTGKRNSRKRKNEPDKVEKMSDKNSKNAKTEVVQQQYDDNKQRTKNKKKTVEVRNKNSTQVKAAVLKLEDRDKSEKDDDDFLPDKKQTIPPQNNSRSKSRKGFKILSSDSEDGEDEQPMKKKKKVKGKPRSKKKAAVRTGVNVDSDSSDSNWEAVEELHMSDAVVPSSPMKRKTDASKGVEIDIELPDKKKKKGYDWAAHFQRSFNRKSKEIQLDMHKTHLVCYLAHGFYCNALCNNLILQAASLSLIPFSLLKQKPKKMDIFFLTKFVSWFRDTFLLKKVESHTDSVVHGTYRLLQCVEQKRVSSYREMVHIFVTLMRAFGEDARLVVSFQPVTMKAAKLIKKTSGNSSTPKSTKSTLSAEKMNSTKKSAKPSKTSKGPKSKTKATIKKEKSSTKSDKKSADQKKVKSQSIRSKNNDSKEVKQNLKSGRGKGKGEGSGRLRRKVSEISYKESKDSEDEEGKDKDYNEDETASDGEDSTCSVESKTKDTRKEAVNESASSMTLSSDSDFKVEIESPRIVAAKSKGTTLKKNRKILSCDISENKTEGADYWVEVYLGSITRWVTVDCIQGHVDQPHKCETRATQPLTYVVAFDKANSAKDVTQKFASKWLLHNRKLRIETEDEDWWRETLLPYKSKNKKRDKQEDTQIQAKHEDQPLPSSVVEYKNHPLYALKRHLLKFEAIYPESAAILGYCKGEAVYSRECVHILKSRRTWIKDARVVKQGEEAYKIVKKLQNPFKPKPVDDPEPFLDVFGFWQTEQYVSPPCKDGKVPRNEYGSVELFQPCMLPKGGVHLQIPGLNRVAAKLGIDAPPAIIGWDYHCRHAVPVLDGFVVCKENAEVLIAAWEEQQEEIARKKQQKKEQRALKHWRLLTKSLLIKERLKKQYQLEEPPTHQEEGSKEVSKKGSKKTKETKAFWPENKMTSFQGCTSNLLPFEKRKNKNL